MKNNLFQAILLIVLMLVSVHCFAQKISNVHPEIEGETIHIYYDLTGIDAGQTATVRVFMSADGGKTYGPPLRSVTGDIGIVVGPGTNRCIIWDVFKDVDELVSVNVKFKVTADLMQSGQNVPVAGHKIKLDLNTNLGFTRGNLEAIDSRSFGINLKGSVYFNQLGLGLRGDYFKYFGENIESSDSGYYWGYAGGAIMEYDLLQDTRYSLYPFIYVGMAKIHYKYDPEYDIHKKYVYSVFGTAGMGFDVNIFKFLYLGVELEYYLSPWLEIRYSRDEEVEGLDKVSIGFVVKFVIDPD